MSNFSGEGRLLFLGTGGSMGVPVIGCSCAVCQSEHPYNKRLRTSALLSIGNKNFLIDAGPDIRQQLLNAHVMQLDALILTHAHYDHTAGLDELRAFFFKRRSALPCLLSSDTLSEIRERFSYLFKPIHQAKTLLTQFDCHVLPSKRGLVNFVGLPVRYNSYLQAGMAVNGFRFGNLAYLTDIREYSDSIFEDLEGIELLVISALRETPSHLHFSVDEAVAFSQRVQARETYLIHLAHEIDYSKISQLLPQGVYLAYDGLNISFQAEFE